MKYGLELKGLALNFSSAIDYHCALGKLTKNFFHLLELLWELNR